MTQDDWIRAISDAAAAWRDPGYPARAAAVRATLEAPSRFTEEGLAFALNHRMHQLRPQALRAWVDGRTAAESHTVGVICDGRAPLDGLAEVLAAVLAGHRVVVLPAPPSPALLPAFLATVRDMAESESDAVRFVTSEPLFAEAEVLIANGSEDALRDVSMQADAAGIPATHRWLRSHGIAVAVIDGTEDAETRSGLAEDLLLHEGVSPRTPAILWAPVGLSPDQLLDTLAGFRELYPAHPDTDGSLRMPVAFLKAAKQPHATGPGFLLSKGEPDPQGPGHVRWTEYSTLADVTAWLRAHRDEIAFVVATERVGAELESDLPVVPPGDAHRPPLDEDGLVRFLTEGLSASAR